MHVAASLDFVNVQCSLSWQGEGGHGIRAYRNKVLRRIFEPKGEEVIRAWGKLSCGALLGINSMEQRPS
jgi:hypothetical protein